MCNNILTYVFFVVLCGLVVLDMWFCRSVVLQMFCVLLVVCVVCLGAYIAYKHHKGTYTTTEQQSNYLGLVSENISLTNELNHIKQKAKETAAAGVELQNLVLINSRLTAQNSNLKTHLQTLYEQLQNAKNAKQTAVLPISTNEKIPLKKAK